ncbi:TOBE domain-containing protein, partial [Geodermatophilus obscurus]
LTEGGARLGGHTVPLPRSAVGALSAEGARTATLGFRPESVQLVGAGEGVPVEVVVVEELGSDAFAYGNLHAADTAGTSDKMLTLRVDARKPPAKGEVVHVGIRPGESHVFSPETGLRVSQDER